MSLEDEARDVALKNYFSLCKEKAAKSFIEWRMEQAKLLKDNPTLKKALRYRRLLINQSTFVRKEKTMF